MKTFFRLITLSVILVNTIAGLQAQKRESKVDQVRFMKKFIGEWKADAGKDTTMIFEIRPFGQGSERDFTLSTQGRVIISGKMLFGYDPANDRTIEALLYKSSPEIILNVWWATSETQSFGVPMKDIADPEHAVFKMKCELKSPDEFIMTHIKNNNVVGEWKFIRSR